MCTRFVQGAYNTRCAQRCTIQGVYIMDTPAELSGRGQTKTGQRNGVLHKIQPFITGRSFAATIYGYDLGNKLQ